MNTSISLYLLYKFSKNFLFLIGLFFLISIETSLIFFPLFDIATPSLISIIIYFFIKKFNFPPSNFILFLLGVLNDIFFGGNLGLSSLYFLLIKYLTERLSLENFKKQYEQDWLCFTIIFIISFGIIFLVNMLANFTIPDFSPILYHIGITLIIFPLLNVGIDIVSFITRLVKN